MADSPGKMENRDESVTSLLFALGILIVGAFGGASILTPLVYSGMLYLHPGLPWPFFRVYSRIVEIIVLILLVILRKRFGLSRLKTCFAPPDTTRLANFRLLLGGVLLTLAASAVLFPFVLQYGKIVYNNKPFDYLAFKFLRTLPAALLIGLIEESFFRVILFERLQQALSIKAAAVWVSVIYAAVHFISPVKGFEYTAFSFTAGFSYLGKLGGRMLLPEVFPAMFGLFLVGLTLCYAVHASRSLYLVIGLHAGWVTAVKMTSAATAPAPGVEFAAGVGRRYYLVSTLPGWMSVVVVFLVLSFAMRQRR